jgi:hypothetical protein
MKCYGDTWGCCGNTENSHVLLVVPPGAVVKARNHDFRWGSAPLHVLDQVKYLGVRLNCARTEDTHIAAAYCKGLEAFHTWRPVLVSPRISLAATLRIIHSVIRPVLEYGMEVWGPLAHLDAGTRKRRGSRPPPPYYTLISSFSLRVAWLAASVPSPANLAGLAVRGLFLKCFCLCVKCCQVNVRMTWLISVILNVCGPLRDNRNPTRPCPSVLPPVLPWRQIIPSCACGALLSAIA